jgi:hypothetical protein
MKLKSLIDFLVNKILKNRIIFYISSLLLILSFHLVSKILIDNHYSSIISIVYSWGFLSNFNFLNNIVLGYLFGIAFNFILILILGKLIITRFYLIGWLFMIFYLYMCYPIIDVNKLSI